MRPSLPNPPVRPSTSSVARKRELPHCACRRSPEPRPASRRRSPTGVAMELKQARVWVTGASSGIGAALVPVLAGRGARVAVSARRGDLLESLATGWRRGGAEILVAPVDVTNRAAVIDGVRSDRADMGRHRPRLAQRRHAHAAVGTRLRYRASSCDAMTLNYFGVLYGIEAVLPGMLRARTRTCRRRGEPGRVSRTPDGSGVRRLEGRPDSRARVACGSTSSRAASGVTIINPGFVRTPLTDRNRFHMPFLMDVERRRRSSWRGSNAAGRKSISRGCSPR